MKKILCFGDSNTWGHNPIDGSRLAKPWPLLVQESLCEYEIIADGVCGRTTAYDIPNECGKNGLQSFEEYIEKNNGADMLIVMLGTNDTLNFFRKNAQESAENIRGYIRLWKASFPHSHVLIISPIHITNYAMRHPVFSQLYSHDSIVASHRFANAYEQLAREEDVYFLDASLYAEPSDADGIHMAPEAHESLAEAVCNKIREIL